MNDPVIKIEKELADTLGFPEEPSVKFLKDYRIVSEMVEYYDEDNVLYKTYYFIEKRPILLKNIHINITNLSFINRMFKSKKYEIVKDETSIIFKMINNKYYKNRYMDEKITYHYRHTDYSAYSQSYKIMNSPFSKDYKPIIIEKIREKIYYYLDKLNEEFNSKSIVIWNNLIELYDIDITNLKIDIKIFIVNKETLIPNYNQVKDNLDDIFKKDKSLKELYYQEIYENKYGYVVKNYINLLNNIYEMDKIICYLQLVESISLYLFGKKIVDLLIKTGLPF